MAVQPCSMCQQRPGDMILSLVGSGDSVWLCIFCLPGYTQAMWEAADLPALTFDIDDQQLGESDLADTGEAGQTPSEAPQEPGALEVAERLDGAVAPASGDRGPHKRASAKRGERGKAAETVAAAADD
jgi:hypothetical protein